MLQPSQFLHYALCGALTFGMLFVGLTGNAGAVNFVPDGLELQVDKRGGMPDVVIGGNGHSMAVWENSKSGGTRISAQRYGIGGSPLQGEYVLGLGWDTNDDPVVAMDASGNALLVWMATNAPGMKTIVGQRFADTGVTEGPTFELAPFPNDSNELQFYPDVAMDANGNALVVWLRLGPANFSADIYGQRYDSTGTPDGTEFLVTSNIGDYSFGLAAAMDTTGDALVVWNNTLGPSTDDIYAQRYDNMGTPLGDHFMVNAAPSENNPQFHPAVAMDAAGNAVVVWDRGGDGDGYGVFAQRYDPTGMPVGSEFQVNTQTNGDQRRPTVDMDEDGNFVVAWQSEDGQDGDDSGVFAQLYDATGTPEGPEFQVNTYTNHNQKRPTVAMGGGYKEAIMIWQSQAQATKIGYGVFGQRFVVNEAPVCNLAQAQPSNLYSNDHSFKFINIDNVSDPDGDVLTLTVYEIYQDETVNATGSGFTSPDGQGIGTNVAEVRDEHVIQGNGRTYRINFTAEDQWGTACSGAVYLRATPIVKGVDVDVDWIIL